jgi:serine/threonine-protein kinase HipA
MSDLKVDFALYGRLAGTITRNGGALALEYAPDYLKWGQATPLSLSLPLGAAAHKTRAIEAYLRGLLPDNPTVRSRWAAHFDLRDHDTLGLMAAIGADVAGGALFAPAGQLEDLIDGGGSAQPISNQRIGDHLRRLQEDDAAWFNSEDEHWSLGGGQGKFTLYRLLDKKGWARPQGAWPSTHIIKPGITRLPAQALVEHLSMRALALLGERVADTSYQEFDSAGAIVVSRFDRSFDAAVPGGVVRIHSEDILQALSYDPAKKYAADGGPDAMRIAALLHAVTTDDSAERFAKSVIDNYLLAAPDGHAKNYTLLLAGNQVALAPLYDVASGMASTTSSGQLRYPRAAMAIGGQNRFGQVTLHELEKFAHAVNIDFELLRSHFEHLAQNLPDALRDALNELPKTIANRSFIADTFLPNLQTYTKGCLEHLV